MARTKYGKYVIEKPIHTAGPWPSFQYIGESDYKSNFTLFVLRVTEPVIMEEYAHTHDFDMYLYFMSYDPDNMEDMGAEIEIGLGKEQEIHKITKPTSVYVPAGMVHCPLNFKKIDKPVLFIHATLASKYYKLPKSE